MSKFIYLLGKGVGLIFRRPIASMGTLLSLFLLFFLFDMLWVTSRTIGAYYDRQLADINIEIFLQDSLPDSAVGALVSSIGQMDGVDTAGYISRDDARARLENLMGTDLLDGFESNPLPRSVIVTFKENFLNSTRLEEFKNKIQSFQGIAEVFYARGWLERVELAKVLARRALLILGIIIFLAAFLNLTYAIRLAVRTGEYGIRQLSLMGGGTYFISFPYIFSAAIYALAASAGSWLVLNYTSRFYSLKNVEILIPGPSEIVYFCLLATLIGLVGGFIGSRRIAA
ncbi:membrane hypothetical protein [Candidatus Zixiibacteriota bacterium]|nr:membrane hypothetical protein [candidate division Zixibacteria bacterium]